MFGAPGARLRQENGKATSQIFCSIRPKRLPTDLIDREDVVSTEDLEETYEGRLSLGEKSQAKSAWCDALDILLQAIHLKKVSFLSRK